MDVSLKVDSSQLYSTDNSEAAVFLPSRNFFSWQVAVAVRAVPRQLSTPWVHGQLCKSCWIWLLRMKHQKFCIVLFAQMIINGGAKK